MEQVLEVPGHQVVQYLGSGARSSIWQIRDVATGEMRALKRVVKRHASDMRFLEQAENEYNVGIELDHPSIRHIYTMRRVKRWLALREIDLIMEMCEGQSLQDNRPDDIAEIVRIYSRVADALVHMNARGFVHADMKPNNVIVAADGSVKVIDLGQSCRLGTVKQRIQGTPDFIAPEQVNRLPLDSRTDVFNFGAALYWTITGRPVPTILPRRAGGMVLKDEAAFVPIEQFDPSAPAPLGKLVVDCVEFEPKRRPDSMKEVAGRLSLISHTLRRRNGNGGGSADGEGLGE